MATKSELADKVRQQAKLIVDQEKMILALERENDTLTLERRSHSDYTYSDTAYRHAIGKEFDRLCRDLGMHTPLRELPIGVKIRIEDLSKRLGIFCPL